MKPGFDLDILIAEKVMGFETGSISGTYFILLPGGCGTEGCGRTHRHTLPSYSTDTTAAWTVLEKFRSQGDYKLEISAYPQTNFWTIKAYHKEGYSKSCTTSAETISMAICLAALKTLEAK